MNLLLPMSGRDSHVTIRNHTMNVGKCIQHARPAHRWGDETKPDTELGIDVGYVRRARSNGQGASKGNRTTTGKESSSLAVVVAALGRTGRQPRVWASAMPRSRHLQEEMTEFLRDSGYDDSNDVCVLTDGASTRPGSRLIILPAIACNHTSQSSTETRGYAVDRPIRADARSPVTSLSKGTI